MEVETYESLQQNNNTNNSSTKTKRNVYDCICNGDFVSIENYPIEAIEPYLPFLTRIAFDDTLKSDDILAIIFGNPTVSFT